MLLKRAGDTAQQESTEFKPNDDGSVHIAFHKFGYGSERSSDFFAIFDWNDVEALTKVFSANGHPAAIRFEHALNLADSIGYFAKNSN